MSADDLKSEINLTQKTGRGQVRRRSSNTSSSDTSIQSRKRGKIDIVQKSSSNMSSPENMSTTDDDEITMKIMEALIKPSVLKALAASLRESCFEAAKEATKDLREEVKNLKISDETKEERITNLETKMDDHEQEKKKCGVVIQGLPEVEHENTTQEIVSFINDKLKIEIERDEILAAFRVGQKNYSEEQHKARPTKVTFRKFERKEQIMKAKSKLKD
jgi:hypothetical protein